MKYLKFILVFVFSIMLLHNELNAQAMKTEANTDSFLKQPSSNFRLPTAEGKILAQYQLLTTRDPLGVTVANGKIIISSTDNNGGNFFDVYDIHGNYQSSYSQGTTSKYGYRDLAFDGTHILASDDSTIKKIDPTDFHVVSQIKNSAHSPHRGLAYDPGSKAIYSTNFRHGNLVKIDAATGATLETLAQPFSAPYGIAFDHYSYTNAGFLWYAEPSYYGKFRLTRVDTSTGNFDFSYDLTSALPDSALSGGLEIINNHPDYPDSVVALMVDQHNAKLVIVNITNTPLTFPTKVEYLNDFGGYDATGLDINSMLVYSGYLFAVNNEKTVRIFDVKTNPAIPAVKGEVLIGDGLDYLAVHNNALFAPYAPQLPDTVMVFDISDPLNWTLKSRFFVNKRVVEMKFYGNYAFVITQDEAKVRIYDISDLKNIQLKDSILTPDNCYSIETDANKGLLFVGYGKTTTGFSVYDVSSPLAPKELGKTTDLWHTPMKMTLADSNHIITLTSENANAGGFWYLECFDISDFSSISKADGLAMSSAWDMKIIDGVILVSSTDYPNKGVRMFSWDNNFSTFRMGGLMEFDHAELIAAYSPAASSGKNIKQRGFPLKDWTPRETYYYFSRGSYVYWPYSYGSEKGKIYGILPPTKAKKVTLTMEVRPSGAEKDGCATVPSVGSHTYTKGASVTLKPIEQPDKGWYFTKWTGDINTTTKEPTITMDDHKVAVANFGKVMLSVSGSVPDTGFCPMAIRKIPRFLNLPINLCASDVDGWNVSSISFVSSGAGNEKEDINGVFLYKGSNLLYYGKYDKDNGTIKAVFNPPLQIPAGECVKLVLSYQFDFNPVTYASNGIVGFHIETGAVSATPMHHSKGIIQGKAKNGNLIFAKVWNKERVPFATIQEAVNSPKTTKKDTIFVCLGEFKENIEIDSTKDGLTIKSMFGRDSTFIIAKESKATISVENANVTIDGFEIDFSNNQFVTDEGFVFSSQKRNDPFEEKTFTIKNSKFKGFGEAILSSGAAYYPKITNTIFENCGKSINTFSNVISLNVDNNTFISTDKNYNNDIEINNSYDLVFADNNFSSPEMKIVLERERYYSSHESFIQNNINKIKDSKVTFVLKGYGHLIKENKNIFIEANREDYTNGNLKTTITQNELTGLKIIPYKNLSDTTIIRGNTFSKNGISILEPHHFYESGKKSKNIFIIDLNQIENVTNDGIFIDEDLVGKFQISNNTIRKNNGNGIRIKNYFTNSSPEIKIHKNKITDNLLTGISIGSKAVITNNILLNNKKGGIFINALTANVLNNYIANSTIQSSNGITFWSAVNSVIAQNVIQNCSAGILLNEGSDSKIINNSLQKNNEAIVLEDCENITVENNIISKSLSPNSGIHLSGSSPDISGNDIFNNNGSGIFCAHNSFPKIRFNNIKGNASYGVTNKNASGSVDAKENYWGANSPGNNAVYGTVSIDNWLGNAVGVSVFPLKDTVFTRPGKMDSTFLSIQNLDKITDNLHISVSDSKGWVNKIDKDVSITDSTGILLPVLFTSPQNASDKEITEVFFKTKSNSTGSVDSGKFFISAYVSSLKKIAVAPNKIFMNFKDTVKFTAFGFDQLNRMTGAVKCNWSATKGKIDTSGIFVADSSEGEATITATEPSSGISSAAKIFITDKSPVLTKVKIKPDTATIFIKEKTAFTAYGFNQAGYPMAFQPVWHATGGSINNVGIFTADSVAGIYSVIVKDTTGKISDTAVVIVQNITGVETKAIPKNYSLSQNYPNPFNPTTTIEYSLPFASRVRVDVFNILGQKVQTLVNKIEKAGLKRVVWNATNFATGVYFVRIFAKPQSGKLKAFTDVKKMVLLK